MGRPAVPGARDPGSAGPHAVCLRAERQRPHGQLTPLGTFGGVYSSASAVNDAGVIVGSATDPAGRMRAFRYQNGQLTMLPTITGSAPGDVAYAVNAAGDAVGFCAVVNFFRHACLWRGETLLDLNDITLLPPSVYLDVAIAINARGQIIAHGKGPKVRHSFVLEPLAAAAEN